MIGGSGRHGCCVGLPVHDREQELHAHTYGDTERITLDLGYRFYSVGLGKTTINGPIPDLKLDPVTTGLACNEMLLTLRIYEPFRRW